MKSKRKYLFLFMAVLFILLSGCAVESENSGLEEIRIGNYEKAMDYFKMALEEKLSNTQTTQEKLDEQIFTEKNENSQEIFFESFKGAYAVFSREIYEWPVDYLFIVGDDFVVDGYMQIGTTVSEITDKKLDGNVLHLQTYSEERLSNKEKEYVIELAYNNRNERKLQLDTGEVLYPITIDDAIETGFGYIFEMSDLLDELRLYDQDVMRMVSYSNTSLLNDYSAEDIEYARVWLNLIGNKEVTELNISYIKAGEIINHYDDNSPVYPEDLTVITGYEIADGMVIYSRNEDGTINVYPVPSHWHTPDEDLPELYREILSPTIRYIEPLKDEEVIPMIRKIN